MTTSTKNDLYILYVAAAEGAGLTPKSINSFANKGAIEAVLKALAPAPEVVETHADGSVDVEVPEADLTSAEEITEQGVAKEENSLDVTETRTVRTRRSTAPLATDELVTQVKDFAMKMGSRYGWDILVECYTDEQIKELIGATTSLKVAASRCLAAIRPQHEQRREIQATAF